MAMLDVSCLTFTLAAFWLYLRGNYPLSGIMVALSALCKLDGALAIIAILLHWLFIRRDKIWGILWINCLRSGLLRRIDALNRFIYLP